MSWEEDTAAVRAEWNRWQATRRTNTNDAVRTIDCTAVRTTHDCRDGEIDERVRKPLGLSRAAATDNELFKELRSDYRQWVRMGRSGIDPVQRYLQLKAAEKPAEQPAQRTGTHDASSNVVTLASVQRGHLVKFAPSAVWVHDAAHRPIRSLADINQRHRACWAR